MHPAALPTAELLAACTESRTRRSGPGGQHRNKVETAVTLIHRPTGISAEGSERRSQAENRRAALARLRLKLAVEHRTPVDGPEPSALWRSRSVGRRLVIAAAHDHFPALIAEALDRLQTTDWQPAPAAERLGVSTSQLIGLLRKAPAGWTAVQRARSARGLSPLL